MATLTLQAWAECRICNHVWKATFEAAAIEEFHSEELGPCLGVVPPENIECPNCGNNSGDFENGTGNMEYA